MEFASKEIPPQSRVLDAGAGSCPYKKYFFHAHYESSGFDKDFALESKHTIICSLDKIPLRDHSYDVIINTQVLEHVEYPQKVVHEFYRILRPGGKLFLTAPQGWGLHEEPNHFYNFAKYGLESLFRNAGFKIVFIKPRGGMFWYLGKRIGALPFYIYFQYIFRKNGDLMEWTPNLLAILFLPFFLAAVFICTYFIPLLFFYLDRLDKKQDYTLGYACYCLKG